MRVISGSLRGTKLYTLDGLNTRPTLDRVKESLFNIINFDVKDCNFLDLFAGSGSLGIEALSNGASKCYFIDNNKEIIKILNENLNKIENAIVFNDNYDNFLKNTNVKFDIIFLDPPYKLNLINNCIDLIIENNLLSDNGLIICEYEDEVVIDRLELIKEKKYGSKKIKIYKNKDL